MNVYETEEQQVEAIKNWWKENGTSIVIGAIIGIGGILGWNWWQDRQQEQAGQASLVYEAAVTEMSRDDAAFIAQAEKLMTDHPDSTYATLSALQLAKHGVENGKPEMAEKNLRWVLAQSGQDEYKPLARLRLARLVLANGNPDEAISLLKDPADPAYKGGYAMVRGEALLAQDRPGDARAAFEEARANGIDGHPTLELLLDSLAPVSLAEEVSAE